jgi:hypothetical protein
MNYLCKKKYRCNEHNIRIIRIFAARFRVLNTNRQYSYKNGLTSYE